MNFEKYFSMHVMLCLLYSILSCASQVDTNDPKLFYSVFPLYTIYFGIMSVPKIHKIYEYNTTVFLTPKWVCLLRIYFHAVLLVETPYVGIITVILLGKIMIWKDLVYVLRHAEKKIQAIDDAFYSHPTLKTYRVSNLHCEGFKDDTHAFQTNQLKVVSHTYQSEQNQNAIKNYVEYRKKHYFAPKFTSAWEKQMYTLSSYTKVLVQNRDLIIYVPFILIVGSTVACFLLKNSMIVGFSCILLLIDTICNLFLKGMVLDAVCNLAYICVSTLLLLLWCTVRVETA